MKRASVSATFPGLVAHKAELSAAGVASTNTAAIAKAIRNLFAKPQLKGKQIHSVQMTVSLINLDQKTIEEMLNKADGIEEESEEEDATAKASNGHCKFCGEKVESLVRHLQGCEKKPVGKTA